ncbi:hypothetical protein [Klenkia marina]|uniref:hypothetical protein n=1 Tax=Klenkia marina TaxID=1960309 RepID=UPI00105961F6|nr:hypothetical protein [Klenkia marina]
MTTNRVPYGETGKAVQAARPPAGLGPSSRVFLRGLGQLRAPLPVLVAGVLMTVPVLALAVASVAVVLPGFSAGFWQGLFSCLLGIILFTLAGLGWRGVKRTVHLGSYDDGFFLARLSLIGLVVVGVAAIALVAQGEEMPWTMALVPAGVAFLWLPWVLLQNDAARAWPQQVELRRGVRVADAEQAACLPGVRVHTCGAFGYAYPAQPPEVVPVHDRHGSGWRVRYTCGACGEPAEQLGAALREGETPELGGSDLWWLGEQADQVCQSAPTEVDGRLVVRPVSPAALDDEPLVWCVRALRGGVRVTQQLLALVPEGADKVPGMRTAGRTVPVDQVTRAFRRDTLEQALSRRQGWLASFEAEVRRRAGAVPPVGA